MIRKAGHITPEDVLTLLHSIARSRGIASIADAFVRPAPKATDLKRDLKRWLPLDRSLTVQQAPRILRPFLGAYTINGVNGYGACVVTPNGLPLYLFGYFDYKMRLRALIVPNGQPMNKLARRPFGTDPLDDDIASQQLGFTGYQHITRTLSSDATQAKLYDTDALMHELHFRLRLDGETDVIHRI